ncbi:hypothetical protein BDN72DRAFT_906696 [Pluteus cervinus]|uniref:Uncharacterized protein n=1 Tax=Pluteus cervinus TaxID=181527 RepID=A0ACD2ZYF5_9AGAR|nr:hypothetical protein BDN72DRAFT_906696 [Pluteus cervinus]
MVGEHNTVENVVADDVAVWRDAIGYDDGSANSQSKKRKYESTIVEETNEADDSDPETKKRKERRFKPGVIDSDDDDSDEGAGEAEGPDEDVNPFLLATAKFGPPRGRQSAASAQTPRTKTTPLKAIPSTTRRNRQDPPEEEEYAPQEPDELDDDEPDEAELGLDLAKEAIVFSSKRATEEIPEEDEEDEDSLMAFFPKKTSMRSTAKKQRAPASEGDNMDVDTDLVESPVHRRTTSLATSSSRKTASQSLPTPSSQKTGRAKIVSKGLSRLEKQRNEVPYFPNTASEGPKAAPKPKASTSTAPRQPEPDEEDAEEVPMAKIPGYVPGSTEHLWAKDARIVFPTDGGLKLTSQSRGIRNLFNEALRLIIISIITEAPWPKRTTAAVLTHDYFKLAAKSLQIPSANDVYKRANDDTILAQVFALTFVNRFTQARLKLRHQADGLLERGYQLFTFKQELCDKFVVSLRQHKAFIYQLDFEKNNVDRTQPFLNDVLLAYLGQLTFAGGEKSLYRRHPALFKTDLEGHDHEEFPGGMIAFGATMIYASLADWTSGEWVASNVQLSMKNYSKKYQEFNTVLDQEFNKDEGKYAILMKTMFERARAKFPDAAPAPVSNRPRKKPMQALGL